MTPPRLTLVSHRLCPYVQRAAIVMGEKRCAFERRDVDLAAKPDWFLALSPLGKTPLLLVGDEVLFESAVICEFLDEILPPAMLPVDPLPRARHRAHVEVASAVLNAIAGFYNAVDDDLLQARANDIRGHFQRIEALLQTGRPYFAGRGFGLVDAAFAPVFRYFDVFDRIGDFGFLEGLPRTGAWRQALSERPSVREAVRPDYPQRLQDFLLARRSALSRRMAVPSYS